MLIMSLKVGLTYSLSTSAPAIFGSEMKKMKFEAAVSFDLANMITPIEQLYAQVYPSLPEPKHYGPKNETYYVFTQLNGTRIVLAESWIIESSIVETSAIPIRIDIADGKVGDIQRITNALQSLGFSQFSITETN